MCGGPWSSVRRSVTDDTLFLCGYSPCGGIFFLRIVDGTCIISGEKNHTLFGAVPFFQRSVRQASVVLCCGVTGRGVTTGCSTDLSAHRLPIFSPGSDHSCPPLFLCTWCLQGFSLRAQRANPTPFLSVAPPCEDLRTRFPSHCWVRHLSSWLLYTDFVELSYHDVFSFLCPRWLIPFSALYDHSLGSGDDTEAASKWLCVMFHLYPQVTRISFCSEKAKAVYGVSFVHCE